MNNKKRTTRYLPVIFFLLTFISWNPSWSQLDSYIGSYGEANKNGYLQPIASVLTGAFNTGQVTHTKIDSNFRVYLHLITTASFILSDKLKNFNAVTGEGFSPVQVVSTPTLLGERKTKTVNGINGTAYTFPAGLGVKFLSLAVPQLALSVAGTELTGRFFAYDTKDEVGKINLFGIGLRHDIGQYFMKDGSWILSIGGMYQKIKAGTYLDLSTYSGALTIGQQQRHVYYFAQAGYQSGKLKGAYKHYNGESFDQVKVDLTSDNPILLAAGLGLNLGLLQLQVQASGITPVIGSFMIGLKF